SVPGKFRIDIGGLLVEIPNVLKVTGSGIVINYDPNYDPATNGGLPQQLVVVQTATITFPRFGVTGAILPHGTTPGLVVYDNGFAIGQAMLIYDPSGTTPAPAGSSTLAPSGGSTGKISFGSILEFDDLRIGVTDFNVTFGADVDFNGTIFVASRGARFLPGKPISATLSDRVTAEPDLAPGFPDTEAIRVSLEFEHGAVKGLIFKVDTLRLTLGSFLTITATDLFINTAAADNEELVSFTAVGAEVTVGSLKIAGEARNFAFMGNGSFKAKAGFGVFLTLGSAGGDSFKWPSWLPIHITQIGVIWPGNNLETDPGNFQLILSASVSGIKGMAGMEFSGAVEGIVIDIGLLKQGKFPVIDIASLGVSIKGNLFGGQVAASLIGGIIKLDANAQLIDSLDTTTPVEDRVFFIGVQGSFGFGGIGPFGIQFAISELGPLGLSLQASIPGGIVIVPQIGLAINDFFASVEFFKTLPSIENPDDLRGSAFGLPTALTPDEWLASVKQQVVTQYRALKAHPGMDGFSAAFTSPMLITGGATIYDIYTSKETFNGQIIVRFSTDGKFLVIGKLNFAANNLSITGKLYADLSKIASGEATVLFLADIPDQVQLLTIDGKFKMGFRTPNGEEAFFTVVDPQTGRPYARLAGPANGGTVGSGTINGRGYIDVTFPTEAGQIIKDGNPVTVTGTLNAKSILDLAPEFELVVTASDTLRLDVTQAPVQLQGNTFRFWTQGKAASSTLQIIFMRETWSYSSSSGEELFNQIGVYEDHDNVRQQTTPYSQTFSLVNAAYIDVRFVAASGAEFTRAHLEELAALGADNVMTVRKVAAAGGPDPPPLDSIGATFLGDDMIRYYFAPTVEPGKYVVTFLEDTGAAAKLGGTLEARTNTFEVVMPSAGVAAPFSAVAPDPVALHEISAIDVNVVNSQTDGGQHYIDITYNASPGAKLDYASILDSTDEFEVRLNGTLLTLNPVPTPIAMEFNADFTMEATHITAASDSALITKLEADGITRFRYFITAGLPAGAFGTGQLEVKFLAQSWKDAAGNFGADGVNATYLFGIDGTVAKVAGPGDGGSIDIGELNSRNYIDVMFPDPASTGVPGYVVDPGSITDLTPEFALSGAGLGSVKLDSGQAPTPNQDGSFRYWVNGRFADGDIHVEFIPGSWSFVPSSGVPQAPTVSTITLNDPSFISVAFDNVPTGFQLDPASITDLEGEFTLNYAGTGTITLVKNEAPIRVGTTNTYRFRVSGNFVSNGSQTATLVFGGAATWAFTKDDYAPAATTITPTAEARNRTYIDIRIQTSVDLTPLTTPVTLAAVTSADMLNVRLNPAELALSGVGVGLGVSLAAVDPTKVGDNIYRYYVSGQFGIGEVIVTIADNAIVDSLGIHNRQSVQRFTVEGPTGSIRGPTNGGTIGLLAQNKRGFIDVTFGFPDIKAESVFDLDPEFTIVAGAGYSLVLDNSQEPVLISQNATGSTFRFWTIGSYDSGTVTVSLLPNSIQNSAGAFINTTGVTLTVGTPATANITYIDVNYKATEGNVLDIDSIIDTDPEFSLYQDANSTLHPYVGDGLAFSTTYSPLRLTGSNTFRYFFTGNFTPGTIYVRFAPSTFVSVGTDLPGVQTATGIGNLLKVESFTVVELTADLIDPANGSTVDAGLLNERGFIDITFTAPPGGVAIDAASVLDSNPELAVAADATYKIDDSQAPVRIGQTNVFRYWYTGVYQAGKAPTLVAGSASFLANNGDAVAVTAITVGTESGLTYIDVRFNTAGGSALDENSILDTGTALDGGMEFTLSGAGLGTAVLRGDLAPTQLGSSSDGIDNNNNGKIDEAEENVYRFYVTRGFVQGTLSVNFIANSWQDKAANPGT
ncbi:MAG TPA: hypothetical protein VK210_02700, partial [Terriglobia bacterium]|nr:hypothetical protein [Terriglobia bacterium]